MQALKHTLPSPTSLTISHHNHNHYNHDHHYYHNHKKKQIESQCQNSLTGWSPFSGSLSSPGLYRGVLEVSGEPQDTWLDMRTWGKGVVFVNGFNLGRFWHPGPTRTLYLPAPLLKEGVNEVCPYGMIHFFFFLRS